MIAMPRFNQSVFLSEFGQLEIIPKETCGTYNRSSCGSEETRAGGSRPQQKEIEDLLRNDGRTVSQQIGSISCAFHFHNFSVTLRIL